MPNKRLNKWSIADLVDLEFFLAQDVNADERVLTRRDREVYRTRLAESADSSRRRLLRGWLDLRREAARSEGVAPMPGEVAAAILRVLPMILFALGALAGTGLAWGVLSYSGDQPINLFAALGWLVALPFFTTLLSAVLGGVRLARGGKFSGVFGGWLLGALLTRLSRRFAESWGILRGRSGLYSGVIGWLAVSLMQTLAFGFSLAVLVTVFLRGWIADLAFSWQTTSSISTEQVYKLVATLARPWAGYVDQPHPTVEQIAGSRVFLKEGLQSLSSADLQSWWYFLLWAILAYAVLPRLLLLGTSLWGVRHALGRISFHDARTEALLRRLQHPQLSIGKEQRDEMGTGSSTATVLSAEIPLGIVKIEALLPDELLAGQEQERWHTEIQRQFNSSVEILGSVKLDEDKDADILQSLAKSASQTSVLLVLEGWQPCITATLEYLKALRRYLGKDRLLIVVLVGREVSEGWRAATSDDDFGIWRSRLAALGDPSLLVQNWRSTHD